MKNAIRDNPKKKGDNPKKTTKYAYGMPADLDFKGCDRARNCCAAASAQTSTHDSALTGGQADPHPRYLVPLATLGTLGCRAILPLYNKR